MLLGIWSVVVKMEVGSVRVGDLLVCVLEGRVRLSLVLCMLGLYCLFV